MENIKLLFYCTITRKRLFFDKLKQIFTLGLKKSKNDLNGKIVAECDFEVEERLNYGLARRSEYVLDGTCLTMEQLDNYLGEHKDYDDKDVYYAIHIKNLKERIMKLNDVYKHDNSYDNMFGWLAEEDEKYIPLDKAPQNMCRVWIYEDGKWIMYILISIRPEWLCKILNGEKTIEIRKRILKEMML